MKVNIQDEALSAEAARRRANVWLWHYGGNLLRAESPELILTEPLVWWLAVALTLTRQGRIGRVGQLMLDAKTGGVINQDTIFEEIKIRIKA